MRFGRAHSSNVARAEPGASRAPALQRLDLETFARDITTEWVPHALARDIDLGFDTTADGAAQTTVDGDAFLLREMLCNLLDNAIRYTPAGGRVTVRVAGANHHVRLAVEDNGPGIPAPERERVFERFHRVLGSGADGCGLGLAIVREIAHSHNAQARLDAGTGDAGTVASIDFPRAA